MTSNKLDTKIISLNTQGLKSNLMYVKTLFTNYDITFISEHWLSNAEKSILSDSVADGYNIHFSPAEKKITGRPFGGNLFVVNKSAVGTTSVVHEDPHILAIKTSTHLNPYLFIGVYLTCYHDASSKEQYTQQLDSITSLIKTYKDEFKILIIGDFQSFPEKLYDSSSRNNTKRNPLSKSLQRFLQLNEYELYDVVSGDGPTTTYQHKSLPNSSYIDHIAMAKNDNISFKNCKIHPITTYNMSDHQPISLTIEFEKSIQKIIQEDIQIDEFVIPKHVWNDENFRYMYGQNVQANSHKLTINSSFKNVGSILLDAAISAYRTYFPEEKHKRSFNKAWWTPQLSRMKDNLSAHFKVWKTHGFSRDEDNIYLNRYLLARKQFRKAVKFAQNKKVYDSLHKMNNLKDTHPKKFWNKIRSLRKSSTKRTSEVNGKQTSEGVVKEFADNFNSLLNNPVINRKPGNSREIPPASPQTNIIITVEDVKDSISKLKENKSADPSSMVSEHIIYANSDQLLSWMCDFFNSIFNTQSTPVELSESIIHPLVKSYKKSLKSFNNYRGISIIPIFTKILEYIILLKCPEISESHVLQHGYKKSSSTLHAEFLIRETIQHYNANNSPVYICGLDAEKAFDSCNWDILFEKLYYEKNIPLSIVNVIRSLYNNSSAKVKYSNKYSDVFSLSQGVRQGSVLSPHLYNIYTEELLHDIGTKTVDCGTSIHGCYTGILMYADDIILMSTTLTGMKKLIETCVSISNKNCINFNSDKTEFCISKANNLNELFSNSFIMNGYTIEPSHKLKHLGVLWNLKNNLITMEDDNISSRITKFWSVTKALVKNGIRFCHPGTIKQLFVSIAIPTLTYGLELCNLTVSLENKLDTEARKALKSLFNVSVYSKNYLSIF